jgi:hypothetical protein
MAVGWRGGYARRLQQQRGESMPALADYDFWLACKRPIEFITSAAVGFPVEIYWTASIVTGVGEKYSYQIMPVSDREGGPFWEWHLDTNEQFFESPLLAAEAFVRAFGSFQQGGHD